MVLETGVETALFWTSGELRQRLLEPNGSSTRMNVGKGLRMAVGIKDSMQLSYYWMKGSLAVYWHAIVKRRTCIWTWLEMPTR